jgi:cytochrome bd-type quinol oxidase subunit 1
LINDKTTKKAAAAFAVVFVPGVATGTIIYLVGRKLIKKLRRK